MRAGEGIYAAWKFVHFQLNSDGLYSQKSVTQTQPKKAIEWVGWKINRESKRTGLFLPTQYNWFLKRLGVLLLVFMYIYYKYQEAWAEYFFFICEVEMHKRKLKHITQTPTRSSSKSTLNKSIYGLVATEVQFSDQVGQGK